MLAFIGLPIDFMKELNLLEHGSFALKKTHIQDSH